MKYEESMKHLKEILDKLDKEELDLDEALVLYEEAIKTYRTCRKSLEKVSMKFQLVGEGLEEDQGDEIDGF